MDRQPYNGAVMRGMRSHVAVDRFTDGHDVVRESKALISSSRRRFAGIIVDICYDHFLARHWSDFSDESLAGFIGRTYGSLRAYRGDMPPVLSRVLDHMVKNDWLGGYREMSGIGRALDGLSMRLRRPNTLAGSVEELDANYGAMEGHFLRFFPDLVRHMEMREDARARTRAKGARHGTTAPKDHWRGSRRDEQPHEKEAAGAMSSHMKKRQQAR